MTEFLIAHALHFAIGAFMVWFLWKAVSMHLAGEGDTDLEPAPPTHVDHHS